MKKVRKIKNLVAGALIFGASIFYAQNAFTQNKNSQNETSRVPYLETRGFNPQNSQNNGNFVIGHGLNQTISDWPNLNQTMQNRGYQTTLIDLPNKGHMGWEANRIVLNNTLSNVKGENNTFFGYSLSGVSLLRYAEENPKFLENNKGSTLILLDPAIKLNAPVESLASLPMRPIAAPVMGKLKPSQTELELTRQDTDRFINTTLAGMPKLAESLAKNNITMHIINLNSEVVNGRSVKSMYETFKAAGVNVFQYTPADVMNNFVPPTIGNKGNFLGGDMNALKVPTSEFKRDNSSHFIHSNTYKSGIEKFVADIASTTIQSVKLDDVILSNGVLQHYPVLKDTQLKVIGTGSLANQIRQATNTQYFNINRKQDYLNINQLNYLKADNTSNLNIIGNSAYNNYFNSNPYINNRGLNISGNGLPRR